MYPNSSLSFSQIEEDQRESASHIHKGRYDKKVLY